MSKGIYHSDGLCFVVEGVPVIVSSLLSIESVGVFNLWLRCKEEGSLRDFFSCMR